MDPLVIIFFLYLFQIVSYILLDRRNLARWIYLILFILSVLNLIVLPYWLMPAYTNNAAHCATPALGMLMTFWVFGFGGAMLIHLTYFLIKKVKANKLRRN